MRTTSTSAPEQSMDSRPRVRFYPLPPISPNFNPSQDSADSPAPELLASLRAALGGGKLNSSSQSAPRRSHSREHSESSRRTGRRHLRRQSNNELCDNPARHLLTDPTLPPLSEFRPLYPLRFDAGKVRAILMNDKRALHHAQPNFKSPQPSAPKLAGMPAAGALVPAGLRGPHNRRFRERPVVQAMVEHYESQITAGLRVWFPPTSVDQDDTAVAVAADLRPASPSSALAPSSPSPPASLTPPVAEFTDDEWLMVNPHATIPTGDPIDPNTVQLRQEDEGDEEDLVLLSHELLVDSPSDDLVTPESHYHHHHSASDSKPVRFPRFLSWETDPLSRFIIHLVSEYYHLRSISLTQTDGKRVIYVFHPNLYQLPEKEIPAKQPTLSHPPYQWPTRRLVELLSS
ncbi:hypothetical protein BJ085DRAFT_40968 [Dimargaris cristalligena]|uniref:R3H-associated N-terminal domain-containing protein n=1 Tax=Dimargaris cristalligena TaxID=215637 RepID=A0A4P9ZNS5_9FUNG|nr:hypothetical protein BJ085DRAFT_40968 [Dimargaris cristalligena]|eukprot:RKP34808.1 hypothetical protein BJ085DRAFT_40968 [Dimargaris cristalligena]